MKPKQYATKKQINHWRNQRRNQKIPRGKLKWKHNNPKPLGHSKSSSKREVYRDTSLPQETRKISNNLTLHLTGLDKKEQTNSKVSRRKEIIKIRPKINEIETKKT